MYIMEIMLALAAETPWARAAIAELPEIDMTPIEWAQISVAAHRMKTPMPTIRKSTSEINDVFLVVAGNRCATTYRHNDEWSTIAVQPAASGAKPTEFASQATLGKAVANALQQTETWCVIPPAGQRRSPPNPNNIQWDQDPGEPHPDDNPTPMLVTTRIPPEQRSHLYGNNAVVYQCTHNNVGNRTVMDGLQARNPGIATLALFAAAAVQNALNEHLGKGITLQTMRSITDEEGTPLSVKNMMHLIQSVRTVIYWADGNRRDARKREKNVVEIAQQMGVAAQEFQTASPAEQIQALANATQMTEPQPPERLHPQAKDAIYMGRSYLTNLFESTVLKQGLPNDRQQAFNLALAYLMAHNLAPAAC